MDLSLLFITLNILTPTNDISSITTNCNYSYRHASLFNEFDDKFGKLNKDCWTSMFNAECIIKSLISKATLHVDAISKTLVFVKSKDTFLLYNMLCTPMSMLITIDVTTFIIHNIKNPKCYITSNPKD
jgi:hypothetical protein